ncbi:hypothetical protein BT67DRAFT_480492 [Trichocladium antarcticum]|uniref:Uncharacterized protein n=1 Tax=Trichocladium antarcticum TaxID=1450529 RepID=A0AAN6UH32_9PEZI|nr:hypothetical protein BT67DRAFT_480492 [Trichocladium antarcticum]
MIHPRQSSSHTQDTSRTSPATPWSTTTPPSPLPSVIKPPLILAMATRLILVCFLSAVVWWGGVFTLYFFPVPVAACTAIIWTSISIYSSMRSAIEDSAAADDDHEESKDGEDSKDGENSHKHPEPESKFLDLLAEWLGPRQPPPEGVRAAEDLWPPLPPGFSSWMDVAPAA